MVYLNLLWVATCAFFLGVIISLDKKDFSMWLLVVFLAACAAFNAAVVAAYLAKAGV